jgi:hypothetical protein
MAVLFFEGFETVGTETGTAHIDTIKPRVQLRWDAATFAGIGTNRPYLIDDYLSEGYALEMGLGSGAKLIWYAPTSWFSIPAGPASPTLTVGAMVHVPSSIKDYTLMTCYGDYGAGPHAAALYLEVENSADLKVMRVAPCAATLGTATGAITPGAWHYIEFSFQIADAPNGWFKVRVNEVEELNVSGVDTNCAFSTAAITSFGFMRDALTDPNVTRVGDDYHAIDDIYIKDDTAFLGAQRIRSLPPTIDHQREWSNNDGSYNNWNKVDENGADDTDYVQTDGPDYTDVYGMTDTDTDYPDTVNGVKVEAEAINATGGTPELTFQLISGASTVEEGIVVDDTVNYSIVSWIQATDPATSAAWTVAAVDALKLGLKFDNGY